MKPTHVGKVVLARGKRAGNGRHALTCLCGRCLSTKLHEFQGRAEQLGAPPDWEHTIPVRAHWRAGANHLKSADPLWRDAVHEWMEERMAEEKERQRRDKKAG